MNNDITELDELLASIDTFNETTNSEAVMAAEIDLVNPKSRTRPTSNLDEFDLQLAASTSANAAREQIAYLNTKLQQACSALGNERLAKQNAIKLLKEKLHELQKLQLKINKMNENIKCCQEHISIERNNYATAKSKIAYLSTKLHAAVNTITQKNSVINSLQTEHAESMRRTKMLIEEFYRYKFLEEVTYSDLENIKFQQLEYLAPEDNYS